MTNANASHELRTPLAITQTLIEVARNDPDRDVTKLIDLLHDVNARAINLTQALLLLSRAEQRVFTRERVDLSLIADEAVESLLPIVKSIAEAHGGTLNLAPRPDGGLRVTVELPTVQNGHGVAG